jgi:FMN phosphatase YigB (HAD superfamily)
VAAPRIDAVAFDIGETLLDRTREYDAWAHWFGVPAHTFSAVFGALVAQGHGVSGVLDFFAAQTGRPARRDEVVRAGLVPPLAEADLYPDARACLTALRAQGRTVVVVGNQPAAIGEQLRALDLDADLVVSSEEWGVHKPDPAFFNRLEAVAGCPRERLLYVGDQLDKDIRPALDGGLAAVRVIRGPWGYLLRDDATEARCLAVLTSLSALPDLVVAQLA